MLHAPDFTDKCHPDNPDYLTNSFPLALVLVDKLGMVPHDMYAVAVDMNYRIFKELESPCFEFENPLTTDSLVATGKWLNKYKSVVRHDLFKKIHNNAPSMTLGDSCPFMTLCPTGAKLRTQYTLIE